MPLVDEFAALLLDQSTSARFEASALQALQNIGQVIVQARTSVAKQPEDSEKSGNLVNMELEEITSVNRDLHLWIKALAISNLIINVVLSSNFSNRQLLVERWSISYIPKKHDVQDSSNVADSPNTTISTAAIRALFDFTTSLPVYKWMQNASAGEYSFKPQYGALPEDTIAEFAEQGMMETCSLPFIESMFGQFALVVTYAQEVDANLLGRGSYSLTIAPSHTSPRAAPNEQVRANNNSQNLLTSSSASFPYTGNIVIPSIQTSPNTFIAHSPPLSRSQAIRIPGSRGLSRSNSIDDFVAGTPYHRGISSSFSPTSTFSSTSDRLPCISPSELIGPFVGSFQESILSGHMSNTLSTAFPGFVADLGVSGKDFIPPHLRVPFAATYYHIDHDTPYVGTIDLDDEGYRVAQKGLIQLTIFNPAKTPIKTFLVKYDLTGMTLDTKTFLRQKIVTSTTPSILRYAIHLRFICRKRKKYYLYKNIRVVFPYRIPDEVEKLKVLYEAPSDPKFFPCLDGLLIP